MFLLKNLKNGVKMKGFIVKNAYFKSDSVDYQVNRIKEELELLGAKIDVVRNAYGVYLSEDCEVVSNYKGYDFCIFLDKDKYLGEMLKKQGLKVFNDYRAIEDCDDKMKTYLRLSGSKIKIPKTISAPLCFTEGAKLSSESADEIIKILGLPLVLKKSFSSLGKGVYLIKDKNELINTVNENPFEPKIYQEFISSSYGKDVRIICIGKKYFSAMLRYSDSDFRSNSALGGKAKPYAPSKEFIEVSEEIARILDLDYMGVDLMIGSSGEPILCEVNSNAFFTTMEKVCGVNVAKAYAMHVVNTVKGDSYDY